MIQNLKDFVAVKGYDVVEYFKSGPKKGNENIQTDFKGGKYFFSSEENKAEFLKNPEKYIPQYGGFCAIAISEGSIVDAHPEAYKIQDDKLLLFYADKKLGFLLNDTRKEWDEKGAEKLKIKADENWNLFNK